VAAPKAVSSSTDRYRTARPRSSAGCRSSPGVGRPSPTQSSTRLSRVGIWGSDLVRLGCPAALVHCAEKAPTRRASKQTGKPGPRSAFLRRKRRSSLARTLTRLRNRADQGGTALGAFPSPRELRCQPKC
jgi:hypothetical protein